VFEQRIVEAVPLRAKKVLHTVEQIRGGKRNETRFGERMRGRGPRWAAIEALFASHCKQLGLASSAMDHEVDRLPTSFRRPRAQLDLF